VPANTLRSSGDLLADRRFGYAQAAFDEGDHAAAAELALQALELARGFAPAHALLGRARLALGAREEAVEALHRALALEPEDALGAGLELARLGVLPADAAMTPAYVRTLFDDYAPRFEKHLVKNLDYRGPELLAQAVRRARGAFGEPFRFRRVLDLGCGTGLLAKVFQGSFGTIEAVDLSPKMLAQARKTHLYDALHEGDLVSFLEAAGEGSFELVVAADVFVYLASLEPAFRAAHRALARGALFAFTVQAHAGEGYVLGEEARYSHAESYLRGLAHAAGFEVAFFEAASTRQDRGADVPGFVMVLRR
jgi:predicted TPR repeat methyltransferase